MLGLVSESILRYVAFPVNCLSGFLNASVPGMSPYVDASANLYNGVYTQYFVEHLRLALVLDPDPSRAYSGTSP